MLNSLSSLQDILRRIVSSLAVTAKVTNKVDNASMALNGDQLKLNGSPMLVLLVKGSFIPHKRRWMLVNPITINACHSTTMSKFV